MIDPSRYLLERAVREATNGNGKPAAPAIPPLDLVLHNTHLAVADVRNEDGVFDGADKALILTHASNGLRVIVPMNTAAAREVGNLLCDRPNIELPE